MMEYWDHWCSIWLKNNTVHGINKPWIEKTSTEDLKNSEFDLRPVGLGPGGQDAVSLYVLACKIFANFPFELKKVAGNSINAAHSMSRNISEGYCRRSLKEYLNHLNIALGSCGEFHSCYTSCKQAEQITAGDYEALDQLHYKDLGMP